MHQYAIVAGDFVKTGGMDRANYALASYLARHDQSVQLIGCRVDSDLAANPNVAFHRVGKPMNSYTLAGPLLASSGMVQFARRRADHVRFVVNGGACCLPATNWVHYVHAAFAPRVAGGNLRQGIVRIRHANHRFSERVALGLAKRVIANSERTRQDVIEKVGVAPDRVRVIYYGIDPDTFRTATEHERAGIRQELGWEADRPHIAFIGALGDRRKGFDVLFDAWRVLRRTSDWDARLVVIGA